MNASKDYKDYSDNVIMNVLELSKMKTLNLKDLKPETLEGTS